MWSRPALVVLVDIEGQPALAHPPDFYDTFYFDAATPMTAAWALDKMDAALTRLTPEPVRVALTKAEGEQKLSQRAQTIVRKVIGEIGSDELRSATRNLGDGDSVVETNELTFIIVDNGSLDGGAVRNLTHFHDPTLRFSAQVAYLGHQVGLMTAVHEILHLWGTVDIYGASNRNSMLSTMAASIFGRADDRRIVLPDPWHRTQLGLTRPRLVDISYNTSGSYEIVAPSSDITNSAILFWDSRRGRRDQYHVEYRSPAAVGGQPTLDDDVRAGFAVWQVNLDRNMNPYETPSLTVADGTDTSINTIDKNGVRGGTAMWKDGDKTEALKWLDGTSAKLLISFDQRSESEATVSWNVTT